MLLPVLFSLMSMAAMPGNKDLAAESGMNRRVMLVNKSGVIIVLGLKLKQNCYEGHPCCNWQAYKWIGIDKTLVVDVGKGEVMNFRYNKINGDLCAAGTVEFILADNPGQKAEIILR